MTESDPRDGRDPVPTRAELAIALILAASALALAVRLYLGGALG
jgi:hypothetical protein